MSAAKESAKVPQRGNRTTGSANEYTRMLLKGMTLSQIGDHFGVTHGAVRKALKIRGLPTNSRALLAAIPTGCTPSDAHVLREANHALAQENTELKKRLVRFKKALEVLKDVK